jgi:Uncharacterised conserved protein
VLIFTRAVQNLDATSLSDDVNRINRELSQSTSTYYFYLLILVVEAYSHISGYRSFMDAICLIESSSDDDDNNDVDDDINDVGQHQRKNNDNGGNDKMPFGKDICVSNSTCHVKIGHNLKRDSDCEPRNNSKQKPRTKPRHGCITIVSQRSGSRSSNVDQFKSTEGTSGQSKVEPTNQSMKEISTLMGCAAVDRVVAPGERGSIDQAPILPSIFSRSVPHRRGHWAGHVKIPLLSSTAIATRISLNQKDNGSNRNKGNYSDSTSDSKCSSDETLKLAKTISIRCHRSTIQFQKWLEHRGHSGLIMEHDPYHLHVSLSKYFSISIANIEPFVKQLDVSVQNAKLTKTRIFLETDNLRKKNKGKLPTILINDERTRSFWCWDVVNYGQCSTSAAASARGNFLIRIVQLVDTVLRRYNQAPYYEPPTFHVSIASFPGDLTNDVLESSAATIRQNRDVDGDDNQSDYDNLRTIPSSANCKNDNGGRKPNANHNVRVDIDEDDDSVDSDDEDSIIAVVVDRIVCTFGTTKEFTIPLL